MAELLRDVNSGGASSSENVKTLRIVPKSKKKDLESLHLSYCFLSKKEFTFPCIHGGRERGRNTGLSRAQPSA